MLKLMLISGAILAFSGCAQFEPYDYDAPPDCAPENDPGQCRPSQARSLCPYDPQTCRDLDRRTRKDDDFYDSQQETSGVPYPHD